MLLCPPPTLHTEEGLLYCEPVQVKNHHSLIIFIQDWCQGFEGQTCLILNDIKFDWLLYCSPSFIVG